jgi:pimeloyl-ACP methyl ester carboxylesterase
MSSSSSCSQTSSIVQQTLTKSILQSTTPYLGLIPVSSTRTLSLRAYGKGIPVLFFPGNLNSRLFTPAWDKTEEIAQQVGVRVITCDRCGVGKSTGPPVTSYNEFAVVINDLLDFLNVSNIAVMGFSSGGPYAIAVASLLKDRIHSLHLISSDGPYAMSPTLQFMIDKNYGGKLQLSNQDAQVHIQPILNSMKHAYEQQTNPVKREMGLADLQEAIWNGIEGCARDPMLETRKWEFDPTQIHCPVIIHHGDDDPDVPLAVCDFICNHLLISCKSITRRIIEKENHTLIRRHWKNILDFIVQCNIVKKEEGAAIGDKSVL